VQHDKGATEIIRLDKMTNCHRHMYAFAESRCCQWGLS